MNRIPIAHFTEFIGFFPIIKVPFNLLPDISQIPSGTMPLPARLIDEFILPLEGEESDEYTEYIPYGRIDGIKDFHAVIYWKASVMQYEFIMATYSPEGKWLSHAIVGGLRYNDGEILHSVAVVHEDLSITIAEGTTAKDELNDLDQMSTYQMAIQPSGQITYGVNEEEKEIRS